MNSIHSLSASPVDIFYEVLTGERERFPYGFFDISTNQGISNAQLVLREAIENILGLTPDEDLPERLTVRAFYPLKLTGLIAKLGFSQGKILDTAYPGKYLSREKLREERIQTLKEFLEGEPTSPPYPKEIQVALEKHFAGSIGVALRNLFPGDSKKYYNWIGRRSSGFWQDAGKCLETVQKLVNKYPDLTPEHFKNEKLSTLLAVFCGNVGLAKFISLNTAQAEAVLLKANPSMDLYESWPESVVTIRDFLRDGKKRLRFPKSLQN